MAQRPCSDFRLLKKRKKVLFFSQHKYFCFTLNSLCRFVIFLTEGRNSFTISLCSFRAQKTKLSLQKGLTHRIKCAQFWRTANCEPRTANREPPNPHYNKCNFSHKEAFAGFAHKRIGCGLFKFLEPNHKTLQNKIGRLKSAAHIVHRISTCAFREVEASCSAAL